MKIGLLGFGAINQKVCSTFQKLTRILDLKKFLLEMLRNMNYLNNNLITDVPDIFFEEKFDYVFRGCWT